MLVSLTEQSTAVISTDERLLLRNRNRTVGMNEWFKNQDIWEAFC